MLVTYKPLCVTVPCDLDNAHTSRTYDSIYSDFDLLLQDNLAFHNIFVCVCTRNIIRAGGSTPATHAMAGPM